MSGTAWKLNPKIEIVGFSPKRTDDSTIRSTRGGGGGPHGRSGLPPPIRTSPVIVSVSRPVLLPSITCMYDRQNAVPSPPSQPLKSRAARIPPVHVLNVSLIE